MRFRAFGLVWALLVGATFLVTDHVAATATVGILLGLVILPLAAKAGLEDLGEREMADLVGEEADAWPAAPISLQGERWASDVPDGDAPIIFSLGADLTTEDLLLLAAAENGEDELKRIASDLRPPLGDLKRASA